jgi:hypothetical protein
MLYYDTAGAVDATIPAAGANSTSNNLTGGCWRPISCYDSGNSDNGHWYLRYYTIKA